ncbi:hypothetical protein F4803DRAFT_376802 [Xylaria telfairii]|nr:hypothetical protein F4803DRAFT_376802 [Xylaria telfairii]
MSGFEIVGVVLAAFPILYDAAGDLRGVMKKAKAWWFFEREFDDFVAEVHKEYVSFSQTIELLLAPLDLAPDERQRLQNERDCTLWHEAHIQIQLRQRIQEKYHGWFMGQLVEMNTALNDLRDMLPFGKVYLLGSTSVDAELFKLKISFSSRKNQLLARVQDMNAALYGFLRKASYITGSNTLVAPSKPYSESLIRNLSHLQSHSQRAFDFLQANWSCNCPQPHHCGITIQGSNINPSINLLLNHEDTLTQVQLGLDAARLKPNAVLLPTTEPEQNELDSVASLKEQISWKRKLGRFKTNQHHGVFNLGISTLSLLSNPSLLSDRHVQLDKAEAKLKKKIPISGIDIETPVATWSVKNQQALQVNQSKTKSHIQRRQNASQRRVRFTEEQITASTSVSTPAEQKMENICEIARMPIQQGYSAYGNISQDAKIYLRVEPRQGSPLHQSTVKEFIMATPGRGRRLQVALAVLRSILCLGTSPWIPHSWDKSHLILIGDQSPDPCPYFFKSSLLSNPPFSSIPASESERTRASLLAAGVLMLELLFRETFELQPFRAQFLNNNEHANEATDICTALMWHKRVGEECGYEISDAIRRCIVCGFDAPPDLGNPRFIEAVQYGVVRPLESFLSAWNNDPARQLRVSP